MDRPVRITAPVDLPVSVDEAKVFLRVDGAEEDDLIEGLIGAAVDHLDGRSGILGRCLVTQVWRYRFVSFQRCIDLDMPGASSAVVRYTDRDLADQTVQEDAIDLVETARGSRIVLADSIDGIDWFGPVEADVTFGTAPDAVPPAIIQAIRMLVAHWFANREAVVSGTASALPLGVQALISPYRWMSI